MKSNWNWECDKRQYSVTWYANCLTLNYNFNVKTCSLDMLYVIGNLRDISWIQWFFSSCVLSFCSWLGLVVNGINPPPFPPQNTYIVSLKSLSHIHNISQSGTSQIICCGPNRFDVCRFNCILCNILDIPSTWLYTSRKCSYLIPTGKYDQRWWYCDSLQQP